MNNIPSNMAGVLLVGHGGPEMLEYRTDIARPDPLPNQVLVRVESAGVNNTDINTRIGWYSKDGDDDDATWSGKPLEFPRIQGADVCGVIVAVGDNVANDRLGERVIIDPCLFEGDDEALETPWYFGSECDGGFAEYTVVAARHAYGVECDLSSVELASFPCSYSTAENMLTRSSISKGDRVLITGASGGVGSAAVQLAKARGAEVIAQTSASKEQALLEIGADKTVLRDDDLVKTLGNNSVDVVIDLVGGSAWPKLLDALKPSGRYAVSGAIAGAMVELDLRTLYLKDLNFFGCTVLEPKVFPNLVSLIEAGKIKPLVAETYPLQDINAAQASFESKKHIGKIVLKVKEATS